MYRLTQSESDCDDAHGKTNEYGFHRCAIVYRPDVTTGKCSASDGTRVSVQRRHRLRFDIQQKHLDKLAQSYSSQPSESKPAMPSVAVLGSTGAQPNPCQQLRTTRPQDQASLCQHSMARIGAARLSWTNPVSRGGIPNFWLLRQR